MFKERLSSANLTDLLNEQMVMAQRLLESSKVIKDRLAAEGSGQQAAPSSPPPTIHAINTPEASDNEHQQRPTQRVGKSSPPSESPAPEHEELKPRPRRSSKLKHSSTNSSLHEPLLYHSLDGSAIDFSNDFSNDDHAVVPMHSVTSEAPVRKKRSLGAKGIFANVIFPDQTTLKELVSQPEYCVEDLYSTEGPWQAIAKNNTFQTFMFAVICINALWIGVNTDCNKADILSDAPWWIQIGENIFCTIFTFELTVRFLSFERKSDAFTDGWFCFDFILVLLMVWETWLEVLIVKYLGSALNDGNESTAMIFRIFRVSRLTRISRVGRISRFLREVPELSILSKAMLYALRSVGATLLLLVVSIYVFAIFFTQMLSGTDTLPGQFDTVLMGMHTLLVQGILADQADLINGMLGASFLYYVVILLYMLVSALTVANMLIGVICDLIGKVSDEKREEMLKDSMETTISKIVFQLDKDANQTISKNEFGQMLHNREAALLLTEAGVDILSLASFADLIFEEDGRELDFDSFMEIVLGFRADDPTVKNQLEVKKYMKDKVEELKEEMHDAIKQFEKSRRHALEDGNTTDEEKNNSK